MRGMWSPDRWVYRPICWVVGHRMTRVVMWGGATVSHRECVRCFYCPLTPVPGACAERTT